MRDRPYGKLAALAALTAAAALTGGCVQATRHSNTMIFGTNTSFGIKAGTSATQTPTIQIGYDRQEAVVMPLVANTGVSGTDNLLTPCNVGGAQPAAGQSGPPIDPCLLVGTNGESTDSYSVLASFGADFGASVEDDTPKAQGGLAQYFATGMAAQILAATGGASVVNSKANPPTPQQGANAVEGLIGSPAARARGIKRGDDYGDFKAALAARINAEPDDPTMLAHLKAFETRIASQAPLSSDCDTKAECLAILVDTNSRPFVNRFFTDQNAVTSALAHWGQ
jgi:hypothetical protein